MDYRSPQVLIVGAGPSGLTFALELTLFHIPFRIIDALPQPSPHSRALVLHPRTLELLSRHDNVVETLLERGVLNQAVRLYCEKDFIFELKPLDFAEDITDTRFKSALMVSQAEVEDVLRGRLRETCGSERGGEVQWGTTAEVITENESGVDVVLRNDSGEKEKLTFRYVIGCDGAHSVVRKAANLSFDGAAYPQDFILADTTLTNWKLPQCLSLFIGTRGFMACFPLKDDVWRVLCSRVSERDSDTEPEVKDFQDCLDKMVPGNVMIMGSDIRWKSRFRLHHRIALSYRSSGGKLFVVGDAAHIHSPAGGQGMNTGIQDAVNLGWKLAAVIHKERNDGILESYNAERRRIGEHLLKGTDRLFEAMTTANWFWLSVRNWILRWVVPWIMSSKSLRASRFRFVSQLGIRYRHSPIVGKASDWKISTRRGGDRCPDCELLSSCGIIALHQLIRDPQHHLLFFSGTETSAVDKQTLKVAASDFLDTGAFGVKLHYIVSIAQADPEVYSDENGTAHQLFGFKMPGYVLVRPDGHIEFIGLLGKIAELKIWVRQYVES